MSEDADHDGIAASRDCDDRDPRVSSGPEWYADADGDGFPDLSNAVRACEVPVGFLGPEGACRKPLRGPADCPADCDDADPDVHARAHETCDGRDQDCDGEVDEHATDAPTWYADADGDGFAGLPALRGCEAPAGALTEATDCDDADADAFPGAVETCDYTDEDCDGVVDDGLVVVELWRDADRDGYGNPASTPFSACQEPLGYASNPDDCDDTDKDEHPGALWHPDADGDRYGDPNVSVESCEQPAGLIVDGTDCDDADGAKRPGVTWWADADGDGFGWDYFKTVACDPGEGWVRNNYDCDDTSAEILGPVRRYQDDDGDGYGYSRTYSVCASTPWYADASGDCDDHASDVHPGATELCDGRDNDCDRAVDMGGAVFWDGDGDGFGAASATGCAIGAWVGAGGDCDDDASSVFPGSAELCNGRDDDCDGLVDGDDPDGSGHAYWYEDADGDGFGEVSTATKGCEGGVLAAGDCDPADPTVSPGSEEACFDAIDQDCDGSLACSAEDPAILGAAQLQLGERAVAAAGDLDGDGLDDVLLGAWHAAVSGRTKAGGAWVRPGGALDSLDVALRGGDGDTAGFSVALAGDLDGDGAPDLAIGAPGWGVSGSAGSVWLLAADTGAANLSTGFAQVTGAASGDWTGYAVGGAGDPDGDGDDDLLVGAPGDDTNALLAGAVALIEGPLARTAAFADAPLVRGEDEREMLGVALLAADLDGDGVPDAVLGGDGVVAVISGGWTATLARSDADAVWTGARLGAALATGDLDGDGAVELVLGDPEDDAVYLVDPLVGGSAATGITASGEHTYDEAGASVAVLDRDRDGVDDLVVGAPGNDDGAIGSGAVYFVYGPVLGAVDLTDADAIWRSPQESARLGTTVAAVGDVDGDGLPDVLAGAPLDWTGGYRAGALYLFAGSAP